MHMLSPQRPKMSSELLFSEKLSFCQARLVEHHHAKLCQSNGLLQRASLSSCPPSEQAGLSGSAR